MLHVSVIFCGFISHLIGRKTINIPDIFSGVHGFTGKTVLHSANIPLCHKTYFNLHLLLKPSFVFQETKNLVNDVSLLKEKPFVNYTSQNLS